MTDSSAVLNGSSTGTATSDVDFGNTLTFPDPGPVFDLPAGFTVSSTQGEIANNNVPEPSPGLLGATALAALGGLARRRALAAARAISLPRSA